MLLPLAIFFLASVRISLAAQTKFIGGNWTLTQDGYVDSVYYVYPGLISYSVTGVNAQQLAIVTETTAILIDKVEDNPLTINGHPAWASEFDLITRKVRALNPSTNAWCATGGFLGNGTFVNSGGNPAVGTSKCRFSDN